MILLIDADILKHRAANAIEYKDKDTGEYKSEPVHHAYYNINSMVRRIFVKLRTTKAEFFLTAPGKSNFRYNLYPDYKGNRKDKRLPEYLNDVHNYIKHKYNACEAVEQEADDDITIRHYELNPTGFSKADRNSCIVSIDKDFNNHPGFHYNFVKQELYYVDEIQAKRNFYLQLLAGDTADNVPRIMKGWLQKKTGEKINKALTEKELLDIVIEEIKAVRTKQRAEIEQSLLGATGCKITDWDSYVARLAENDLRLRGQLLHLRTKPDEMWEIPLL